MKSRFDPIIEPLEESIFSEMQTLFANAKRNFLLAGQLDNEDGLWSLGTRDARQIVVEAYSLGPVYDASIRPILNNPVFEARQQATQDILNAGGKKIPDPYVLSGWAAAELSERVEFALDSTRGGFNDRLDGFVVDAEQELDETPTRETISRALEPFAMGYLARTASLMAVTEILTQFNQQFDQILKRNGFDPMVRVEPESYDVRCRHGCPEIAGKRMRYSEVPTLPLHPGCIHYTEIEDDAFSLGAWIAIDIGMAAAILPSDLENI